MNDYREDDSGERTLRVWPCRDRLGRNSCRLDRRRVCIDGEPVLCRTRHRTDRDWKDAIGLPEGSSGREHRSQTGDAKPRDDLRTEHGRIGAAVEISVFFADRKPAGSDEKTVPARRTRHVRFDEFDEPVEIPTGPPFASVIESDVSVVVQHTRLDSRQAENALLSTIAYPSDS